MPSLYSSYKKGNKKIYIYKMGQKKAEYQDRRWKKTNWESYKKTVNFQLYTFVCFFFVHLPARNRVFFSRYWRWMRQHERRKKRGHQKKGWQLVQQVTSIIKLLKNNNKLYHVFTFKEDKLKIVSNLWNYLFFFVKDTWWSNEWEPKYCEMC